MKQPRLGTVAELIEGGANASAGAAVHGVSLNLVVGSKVLIDGDLNALTLARDAHASGIALWANRREVLKLKSRITYDVVFGARDVLKRSLGKQYSAAWSGTGFSNSLRVPRALAPLQNTAGLLKGFLAQNPALEVPDVVTSALVDAALTDLTNAQSAANVQKSAAGTLLTNRKQKEKALRLRLRGLAEELNRLIGPMDDRWTAFGLNRPGMQQTPDRPEKVSFVLRGEGVGSVKWKGSARAEYYRLWMKIVGVDAEALPVASRADLEFTLESLPSPAQIELSLSAVNNGGESARSEVLSVTIP